MPIFSRGKGENWEEMEGESLGCYGGGGCWNKGTFWRERGSIGQSGKWVSRKEGREGQGD